VVNLNNTILKQRLGLYGRDILRWTSELTSISFHCVVPLFQLDIDKILIYPAKHFSYVPL